MQKQIISSAKLPERVAMRAGKLKAITSKLFDIPMDLTA